MSDLPYLCPDHPEAQIRHSWVRTRSEANHGPNRPRHLISEIDSHHKYECAVCGCELAPPKEATDE